MQYLDPNRRLSLNFYVYEFCRSDTADAHGIDIQVVEDSPVHKALTALAHYTLQPVREQVGLIHITSGYRPAHVNELVGGVADSQHTTGEAADCWHDVLTPLGLAEAFADTEGPFDQLILEHDEGVVHVSHVCPTADERKAGTDRNRHEVLTRYRDSAGEIRYLRGLVAEEDLPS